jgi:hypothetical protein
LVTAHVSMLLKSRASPDMFPFILVTKKRPPLTNDTINSVLQQWEVDRAKDLSAPLTLDNDNKQLCY